MKTPRKGYYTVVEGGYQCPVCTVVYVGAFARHDAVNCCSNRKPYAEALLHDVEALLDDKRPPMPTPRTKRPGDGTRHKDKWQHWYRGQNPDKPEYIEADIIRAAENILKDWEREQIAALDKLYPETPDGDIQEWLSKFHHARTSAQKIAYAFNSHHYYALLSAVEQYTAEAKRDYLKYIYNHLSEFGLTRADGSPEPLSEKPAAPVKLDLSELMKFKAKGL